MPPSADIPFSCSVLYHSTRICLNLPFITESTKYVHRSTDADRGPADHMTTHGNHPSGCIEICKSSAEAIVDILDRFRSQHTLVNAPILLVHGAIVATNAVLVTSRHHQGSSIESPPLQVQDTLVSVLDIYLQELSVSWPLAGEARNRFRRALYVGQPPGSATYRPTGVDVQADESLWIPVVSQVPSTAHTISVASHQPPQPENPCLHVVDPALVLLGQQQERHGPHAVQQISPQSDSRTMGASPELRSQSPGAYVWDPMGVAHSDVSLWASIGADLPAVPDMDFMSGFGWFDPPQYDPTAPTS